MCVSSFGSSLQDPLKAYHAEVIDICTPLDPFDSKILQVVKKILIALIIPIAYFLLAIPYGIGALLRCISTGNFTHTPYVYHNPHPYRAPLPPAVYVPPAVIPLPAPLFFPPPPPAPAPQPYHHPNAPDKSPDAAVVREGRDLESGIKQLKESGESWWREAAVNLIRRARVDSHEDEYTRLWCAGLLNPTEDEKIDQALAQVNTNGLSRLHENKPKALAVKVLLGQAMEIQRIYKDTHHVFLHAQETRWIIFTYFLKEIAKKAAPHINLQQYKYLRVPSPPAAPSAFQVASYNPYNLLSSYMPQPVVGYNDARKYARQVVVNDSAGTTRDELLSVDAYFYNFASYESSLHFLANNCNVNRVDALLRNVVKFGIRYFYPAISDAALEAYANQVAAIPVQASPCGNLFVICTPKERAEEFHYRAHPYGVPCRCHSGDRSPEIIDRLQEGVSDATTRCASLAHPQFRVYTPLLSPHVENREHKIYLLTPFAKAYRKALKAQVKALATLIHQSVNPAVPCAT